MADSPRRSLTEWEEFLAPQVRGAQLRLIGEIGLTADEGAALGSAITSLHKRQSRERALKSLRRQFPCSFAAFLVTQGIYGYAAGNYWGGVATATGLNLNPADHAEWGLAFEEILEEFGLPQFQGMGGARYVSVILAHGGIPSYSLNDFFRDILQPAVIRPQYSDLSPEELVTELLQRSSVDFSDKPVRRFLEYGGEVAVNFLDRCREMALEFMDTGLIPSAHELGLPRRVVEAYQAWVVSQERIERRVYHSDDLRLRRPELILDPWGQGVGLHLPSQLVPATLSQAKFAWRLTLLDGEPITIPLRVRRMGFDLRTNELPFYRLAQPAQSYQVEFVVDTSVRRTWRIAGLSPERPLLLFDSSAGTLVNWLHDLPAERVWLLYHEEFHAECEGEGAFVDLPTGYGAWAEYKLQEWNLTRARRLVLSPSAGQTVSFVVRASEAALRPILTGGQLFPLQQPTRRTPLYIGSPPVVSIPLTGKHALAEELAIWRLTIRSRGVAQPEISRALRVAEVNYDQSENDDGIQIRIPLAQLGLLGDSPVGEYQLRLRGPLGLDADLPFRVWPQLEVEPLEALYLPDPQSGPNAVPVILHLPATDQVEFQTDEATLLQAVVSNDAGDRRVTVQANGITTVLNLSIARPAAGGQYVRVPVQIPIPRLRWVLLDEAAQTEMPSWGGELLRESLDSLQQLREPAIFVSLPVAEPDRVSLRLRLASSDGVNHQTSLWAQGARQQREWRFSLTGSLDALRHSSAPVMRLELECAGLPSRSELVSRPLLSVTKALLVEDVQLEGLIIGDKPHLRLRWREAPQPLRHRHVRIWPVWQPWRKPVEQTIPDEALGEFVFPVPTTELPIGRLRLQFSIEDPWLTATPPSRLPHVGPGVTDVVLVTPERRMQQIAKELEGGPKQFAAQLERACLAREIGDDQAAQGSFNWCYQNLDAASPQQALALDRLLEDLSDSATRQGLRLKLFAPSRLDRLLGACERGEINQATYDDYMALVPAWGQLSIETCLKLLTVDVESVQLAAIQQLIEKRRPEGPEAVLQRLAKAQLSEADAVALLSRQGEFVVSYLQARTADERLMRLLEQLAPKLGEKVVIVTPGTWIRTSAGWGQITEILDGESGRTLPRFLHTERRHKLMVTLRPSHDAEKIQVDFADEVIRFVEAKRVYSCSKCRQFSARDQQSVVSEHERAAHWTNSAEIYTGIGGSVATEPDLELMLTERKLAFSFRAPINQWA